MRTSNPPSNTVQRSSVTTQLDRNGLANRNTAGAEHQTVPTWRRSHPPGESNNDSRTSDAQPRHRTLNADSDRGRSASRTSDQKGAQPRSGDEGARDVKATLRDDDLVPKLENYFHTKWANDEVFGDSLFGKSLKKRPSPKEQKSHLDSLDSLRAIIGSIGVDKHGVAGDDLASLQATIDSIGGDEHRDAGDDLASLRASLDSNTRDKKALDEHASIMASLTASINSLAAAKKPTEERSTSFEFGDRLALSKMSKAERVAWVEKNPHMVSHQLLRAAVDERDMQLLETACRLNPSVIHEVNSLGETIEVHAARVFGHQATKLLLNQFNSPGQR